MQPQQQNIVGTAVERTATASIPPAGGSLGSGIGPGQLRTKDQYPSIASGPEGMGPGTSTTSYPLSQTSASNLASYSSQQQQQQTGLPEMHAGEARAVGTARVDKSVVEQVRGAGRIEGADAAVNRAQAAENEYRRLQNETERLMSMAKAKGGEAGDLQRMVTAMVTEASECNNNAILMKGKAMGHKYAYDTLRKSQEAERRFAVFSEAASIAAYKLRNKLQEAAAKLAQQGQFAAEEATYLGTEAAHARQEAFAARERAARESQLAQSQVEAANRAVVEAGSAAAREREQAAVYAKSQAEREASLAAQAKAQEEASLQAAQLASQQEAEARRLRMEAEAKEAEARQAREALLGQASAARQTSATETQRAADMTALAAARQREAELARKEADLAASRLGKGALIVGGATAAGLAGASLARPSTSQYRPTTTTSGPFTGGPNTSIVATTYKELPRPYNTNRTYLQQKYRSRWPIAGTRRRNTFLGTRRPAGLNTRPVTTGRGNVRRGAAMGAATGLMGFDDYSSAYGGQQQQQQYGGGGISGFQSLPLIFTGSSTKGKGFLSDRPVNPMQPSFVLNVKVKDGKDIGSAYASAQKAGGMGGVSSSGTTGGTSSSSMTSSTAAGGGGVVGLVGSLAGRMGMAPAPATQQQQQGVGMGGAGAEEDNIHGSLYRPPTQVAVRVRFGDFTAISNPVSLVTGTGTNAKYAWGGQSSMVMHDQQVAGSRQQQLASSTFPLNFNASIPVYTTNITDKDILSIDVIDASNLDQLALQQQGQRAGASSRLGVSGLAYPPSVLSQLKAAEPQNLTVLGRTLVLVNNLMDGHISRNAFSVAGCGGTLDCELNVDDLQQYITPKGQQQQQSNLFGWRREGEEWLGAYTPPSQLRSSTQPQFQQQSMASSSYMQGQPAQTATTSSFQQNKNYPTTATAGQRAGQVSF